MGARDKKPTSDLVVIFVFKHNVGNQALRVIVPFLCMAHINNLLVRKLNAVEYAHFYTPFRTLCVWACSRLGPAQQSDN